MVVNLRWALALACAAGVRGKSIRHGEEIRPTIVCDGGSVYQHGVAYFIETSSGVYSETPARRVFFVRPHAHARDAHFLRLRQCGQRGHSGPCADQPHAAARPLARILSRLTPQPSHCRAALEEARCAVRCAQARDPSGRAARGH
eukprot:scaffold115189_cov84-Phaeocystis_antarctica.AAC.3